MKKVKHSLRFLERIKKQKEHIAEFLGYSFVVCPGVLPIDNNYSYSSIAMAKDIPKNAGVVLDMGAGSGVQAIIAAKKGAKKVVAADISEQALNCARKNIKLHNLEDRITLVKSNMFESVSGTYDLILAELPFTNFFVPDELSGILFDPGYKIHDSFLKNVRDFLKPNGTIKLSGGDLADESALFKLLEKHSYNLISTYKENLGSYDWKIYTIN